MVCGKIRTVSTPIFLVLYCICALFCDDSATRQSIKPTLLSISTGSCCKLRASRVAVPKRRWKKAAWISFEHTIDKGDRVGGEASKSVKQTFTAAATAFIETREGSWKWNTVALQCQCWAIIANFSWDSALSLLIEWLDNMYVETRSLFFFKKVKNIWNIKIVKIIETLTHRVKYNNDACYGRQEG